jgi:Tol biopolymer transport system component
MNVSVGMRLGSYLIRAPLGGGGMGKVWRAYDAGGDREVAVKVLNDEVASDPEYLKRFEHEARAVGSLNHPNLLHLYVLGTHDGSPYMVTELLEGQTLRQRLGQGAMPARKAVDVAVQIARGLAAAHTRNIVHRDLKPENLFVMTDGRVKILDFGLAKKERLEGRGSSGGTVSVSLTEPGMFLGTVGYAAPEQVRSETVDARADLFALGCVLYEMLTGRRAFEGRSRADTQSQVLNVDPELLPDERTQLPPGLEPLVHHCLEKDLAQRFQSAADVAFALENLPGSRSGTGPGPGPAPPRHAIATAVLAGAVVLAAGIVAWRWIHPAARAMPTYQRLTYQRGTISEARFSPDGQTVVYSASWDGGPYRLYTTRIGSPESSALDLPSAALFSVGANGMLAVAVHPAPVPPLQTFRGTLAQVPLSGGAPRELIEDVTSADWSPDGSQLAVVRMPTSDGAIPIERLEMPAGHPLHGTTGWLSHPRVSPRGDQVAFLEHPASTAEDRGFVMLVDKGGKARRLTEEWDSVEGIAWSPDSREIWFSAAKSGYARDLWSVTPSGRLRLVMRMAGGITLHDVSRRGRVLFTRDLHRDQIIGATVGNPRERDLSWLDWSDVAGLSSAGDTLLFAEMGEGAGAGYAVCMRRMDGSPVVRLGDGFATGLSPDGRWALSIVKSPKPHLNLLPTGPGTVRSLDPGPISMFVWASWSPDGRSVVSCGSDGKSLTRQWIQDAAGGAPRPITPAGVAGNWLTADGRFAVAGDSLYPLAGGPARHAPGLLPGDIPADPATSNSEVFVWRWGSVPVEIYRVNLLTGRRELWRKLTPEDPAGLFGIGPVAVSRQGRSYAYTCGRLLSDLYLGDGLR